MINLKPTGTNILLRFLAPDSPKKGDIYLGANVDKGPQQAVVIALGSGRDANGKVTPFEVQIGDTVIVSRYTAGTELKEGGETYCVVKEDGLLGVVEVQP